ncbi:MAG: FAD:protein FMN transferase, partial [Kocuria sp.]|nr:FAD:protein FMN transferase [Kocuria sp.]
MPSRDKEPTSAVYRFAAIGTGWQIRTNHPLSDAVTTEIAALCEHFDRTWSRFRADSMVTEIAQAHDGGRFVFPARDASLLDLYDGLVDATAGGVDPLIGRDLELLGYDANYLLRPDRAGLSKHVPDSWDRDLRREETTLIASRPVLIDIGAAGKGHLVDLIADVLVAAGIGGFVVDGGGDLRHAGSQPVVVGLEHTPHSGRVLGTVK